MTKRALILIDMQYDFLPGGSLAVPDGNEVIPVINRIQHDFDLVVATQDWHPDGHRSFASSHPGKKEYDVISLRGQNQVLWPDHCVQGSQGAELTNLLDWRQVAAIFRKGMDPMVDSYSGFYDNHRLNRTGLAGYLRELKVTDIYVAGLAADYCVYYTARDGQELGFNAHFVENATKAIAKETYDKALDDMKTRGVEIVSL